LPSFYFSREITDLQDILSPNGKVTVYKNGAVVSSKKITFNCKNPKIYEYVNGKFEKKIYKKEGEKTPVFKYKVVNGVGDSFVLKCDRGWYVFKPFRIVKVKNEDKAKSVFLNSEYFPKIGSYY
jgi:hypothetical protein